MIPKLPSASNCASVSNHKLISFLSASFHFSRSSICCKFQRSNKFRGSDKTRLYLRSNLSRIFLTTSISWEAFLCWAKKNDCHFCNKGLSNFSFSISETLEDKVLSSSASLDNWL